MIKKFFIIIILTLFCTPSFSNFKEIKKKAKINNPEIIFPIQKGKKGCIKDLYISPDENYVLPVLKVEAPSGYGLDNRFDYALSKFEDLSFPCGSGNVEACRNVKRVI